MSTKPPAAVQQFSAETLEKIAYSSVSTIGTEEPNDRNRLGYHVCKWLQEKQGTLAQAVAASSARMKISHVEAVRIIAEALGKAGIQGV